MSLWWAAVLLASTGLVASDVIRDKVCSARGRSATVNPNGDVFIRGFMTFSRSGDSNYGCGTPHKGTMQTYEAMRWALARINQDSGTINGERITDSYIPGVRLGMEMKDTCSNPDTATWGLADYFPSFTASERDCARNQSTATIGVIAPHRSATTADIVTALKGFSVPVISAGSTASFLSNTDKYPNFLRTIVSDTVQVQAMLATAKALGWTNVAIVYTNDPYGLPGFKGLRQGASNAGICVSTAVSIESAERDSKDDKDDGTRVYREAMSQLVASPASAVIYFGGPVAAEGLLEAGASFPGAGRLQWLMSETVGTNFGIVTNRNYARGILTVSPGSRHIAEFEDHWVRLSETRPPADNPWYSSWYMTANNCRLPGVNYRPYNTYPLCPTRSEAERRAVYSQSSYVEPAIIAIFSYAKALKNARRDKCLGLARGVCPTLMQMDSGDFFRDYLSSLDFTFTNEERVPTLASAATEPDRAPKRVRFDENGDIIHAGYNVYSYNDRNGVYRFNRVGTYNGNRLDLNLNLIRMYDSARLQPLPSIPTSGCPPTGCATCLSSGAGVSQPAFVSGDVIIGGFFSVHDSGKTSLTCGAIKKMGGPELVEAFLYGLKNAVDTSIWRGNVRLGAIAFDDCSNKDLATNLATNFIDGNTYGVEVDPRLVNVFTGGNDVAITTALAQLLAKIPKPMLGYRPAPSSLSNAKDFPFFDSIVPGSADEVQAVAQLLKRMGLSHVVLVHGNDKAAGEFLMHLRKMASDVCVAAVGADDLSVTMDVMKSLQARSTSRVLLLHGDASQYGPFLAALNRTSNAGEYVVMTTSAMMADSTLANRRYRFRIVALTLKTPDMDGWGMHLRTLTPNVQSANPWLREWYESAFNCHLDASNQKGYPKLCENTADTPITSAPGFAVNPYSYYVIMAVGALGRALDKTLQRYCGASYSSVCSRYRNVGGREEIIMQYLREDPYLNGDLVNGYDVMYKAPGGSNFLMIGDVKYTRTEDFTRQAKLEVSDALFAQVGEYQSTCGSSCSDCLYMYELQPSFAMDGDLLLAGVFNVHLRGETPYSCDGVRVSDGFQYTEAFKYAIDKVNAKTAPVSLNGVSLGGVVLDACSSDLRASNLVSSLYSGAITRTTMDGKPIDVNDIQGWLMYTSDASIQVASTLGRLGVPSVTPSATSTKLNDRARFPTFYRTVPADDKLADALSKLVNYMGWKFVQTLNSPDTYGRTGIQAFKQKLNAAETCASASYEFGTDGSADSLVAKLLTSSTSVVVVFAGEEQIKELIEAKVKAGQPANNLVFITSETMADTAGAKDTLGFRVDSPTIQEFSSYLGGKIPGDYMDNPWFSEYYQAIYQCNLDGDFGYDRPCGDLTGKSVTTSDNFQQDFRVLTTVNAVYALVNAIDLALKERCGDAYGSVCDAFRDSQDTLALIVSKLNDVSFSDPSGEIFQFVDRQHNRGYSVYRFGPDGSALNVGSYKSGALTVTDPNMIGAYGYVKSTCAGTCTQCQYQEQAVEEFTYKPGEILLAGLFDVHSAGRGAFACGEINIEQGWQLLEAFNFAIDQVNAEKGLFRGLLPGVTVGGVGLDTCQSPTRAANLVANVQSGLLPLRVGSTRVNPDRVDVYIGAYDSDTSEAVSGILNVLGVPQLSYGSTSTVFKDHQRYPYFLRTVPADDKLARAIVALLKNFEIEYVQIVNSPGTYGDQAAEVFHKVATENGICVAATIQLNSNGRLSDAKAEQAVQALLKKPQATVVVTFITTDDINTFLRAVGKVQQASRFKFIGSDTWGNRLELLNNVGDVATDTITLGVETADLTDFDRFLEDKNPANYPTNPWFDEFYEAVFDCSLTPGSAKYPRQCRNPSRPVVRAPGYKQDSYVLYTVNAVYSAALGIHYALQDLCGVNYYGLCEAFLNSGERREKILAGIRKATFTDATRQSFEFSQAGESSRGYHIYTTKKLPSSEYYYDNVGSYNDTHLLKIRPRPIFEVNWKSNCEPAGACDECPLLGRRPTRSMEKLSTDNLNLVGFFDVHSADPIDPLRCGPLNVNLGFQNVLAFFYAIDRINRNLDIQLPPSLRLGGIAIDTCSNPTRVSQDTFWMLLGRGLCDAKGGGANVDPSSIVAVLPQGTANTRAASQLLSPRGITILSPTATADSLSGTPYFLRTVMSDRKQAEAMAQVMKQQGWSYVSAVNSDSEYGNNGMAAFFNSSRSAKGDNDVCIGKRHTLAKGASLEDAKKIVSELNNQQGARVVALFMSAEDVRLMLQAARDLQLENRFIWFGTDTWGSNPDVTRGLETVAQGSISIQVRTEPIEDFRRYVQRLTVADHGDIPNDWFEEFWQQVLKCKLENSTVVQDRYARVCGPSDRITADMLPQDDYVLQTIIATYMAAQGLNNVDDCRDSPLGVSGCLAEKGAERRQIIYDNIKSAEWSVLPSLINRPFNFRFDDQGSGSGGYYILNYQRDPDTGTYGYRRIGRFDTELEMNEAYVYDTVSDGSDRATRSSCGAGRSCQCVDFSGKVIGTGGGKNGGGTNGGGVEPGAVTEIRVQENFYDPWGIVVAVLTAIGIIVTICAFVYLLIAYPVRGGTSALGFLLLFGVLAMYVLVFAFIFAANFDTCVIRRFCLGLVYALIFSCMLVKVLNTWRLGSYLTEYLPSYERLAHPCSLVTIVLALTLVQVIIGTEWLILRPPYVDLIIDPENTNRMIPRCRPADFHNEELVMSCIYVMVLMLLTLIFAAVTWDSEENHRESRWLLITTCFSIGILLVWTIVSTLTAVKYREPAIAIALLVNATIILLAIFIRKIYLLNKYKKQADSHFGIHDDVIKHENDAFSTLYANQAFDTSGDVGSRKGPGSHTGSGVVYVYDGVTGGGMGQTTY